MTNTEDAITQAAGWIAREPGSASNAADAAKLREWLAEDERNLIAATRANDIWTGIGALADDPDLRAVVPLPTAANDDVRPRRRRIAFAAVGALALIGIVAAPPPAVAYQTNVGEQRSIDAPRGVKLVLNTASRVSIAYGWFSRRIVVESGEADVTVDEHFMLPADIVLGPAAQLRTNDGRVLARVGQAIPMDGSIFPTGSDRPLPIDHLVKVEKGVVTVSTRPVERDAATAWQRGLIVFDNVSLDDAMAEFARYQSLPYRLTPTAAALRISGTYRTTEVRGFVASLPRVHRVKTVRRGEGVIRIASTSE